MGIHAGDWGGRREATGTDWSAAKKEGWVRGSVFGWRKGLREKGRLAWVGAEAACQDQQREPRLGVGGQDPGPGGPRSWTELPLRNLSLGALPLPKAPVLKSPRHLRLQEGKEPEKRIADHMDLFPGF